MDRDTILNALEEIWQEFDPDDCMDYGYSCNEAIEDILKKCNRL